MLEQLKNGLVAQLGAHHIRIVGVVGSNPIRSTCRRGLYIVCGGFFDTDLKMRASTVL